MEIVSDGTSLGKSTLATRTCHFYREAGREVTMVQIESSRRRHAPTGAATTEVFIPLEDFVTAGGRNGGLTGVLTPLFDEILRIPTTNQAVVVDWPGGSAGHRLDVLAATSFGALLASMSVKAISMVLTSATAEHMAQADRYLKGLQKVAPQLPRALVLSGRSGPFEWPAQSEQAEAHGRLLATAGDIPIARIPLAAGRALQVCADADLDPATAMMTDFEALARRLGVSVFHAAACASELALWWERTGHELRNVLAVPADEPLPA